LTEQFEKKAEIEIREPRVRPYKILWFVSFDTQNMLVYTPDQEDKPHGRK
jgi:hypothetical protein